MFALDYTLPIKQLTNTNGSMVNYCIYPVEIYKKCLSPSELVSRFVKAGFSGGQSTQIKYLSKSTDTYSKILLQ